MIIAVFGVVVIGMLLIGGGAGQWTGMIVIALAIAAVLNGFWAWQDLRRKPTTREDNTDGR